MDNPFFRSRWNYPLHSPYAPSARNTPVERQSTMTPKVVTIPVHFAGSEQSRINSALKIQRVFRGFMVRKNVKNIAALKREIDGIERWLAEKGTVELIRIDAKERLKVNETLMSLLFRLDSVRGVDSGVRDCRKAAIRKAIALQEKIDNIVAADGVANVVDEAPAIGNGEGAADPANRVSEGESEKIVEETPALEADNGNSMVEIADNSDSSENGREQAVGAQSGVPEIEQTVTNIVENCNLLEDAEIVESMPTRMDYEPDELAIIESTPYTSELKTDLHESLRFQATNQSAITPHEATRAVELPDADLATAEAEENEETSGAESESDSSANPQSPVEGMEDGSKPQKHEENCEEERCIEFEGREENRRSRELLERMMADNRRIMGLMADLFERNEMQTRLLSSLSQRVELLEKAFMCDKLRRKKKRNCVASTIHNTEKCTEPKKCGKRLFS